MRGPFANWSSVKTALVQVPEVNGKGHKECMNACVLFETCSYVFTAADLETASCCVAPLETVLDFLPQSQISRNQPTIHASVPSVRNTHCETWRKSHALLARGAKFLTKEQDRRPKGQSLVDSIWCCEIKSQRTRAKI